MHSPEKPPKKPREKPPGRSTESSPLGIDLLDAAVEVMGRSGRGGRLLVQGSSMIPTLVEGQQLHTDFHEFHPRSGDLLLFRQVDYLVVHRYLGRCRTPEGQAAFRTRGDGRLFLDPPVLPGKVVGRVVAARYGDRWLNLRGTRARCYGRAVAAHCFAWTAVGVAARKADRLFARLKLPQPWVRSAEFLDRLALSCAHALFFRISHREIPAPPLPAAAGD